VELVSHAAQLRATFVPSLGMLGASLRHRGEELLGRRAGLAAYAARGETMGIPLLHPWANRLGGFDYRFGGRRVELDGGTPLDDGGLPIHGLLGAVRGWRLADAGAGPAGA